MDLQLLFSLPFMVPSPRESQRQWHNVSSRLEDRLGVWGFQFRV